MRNNFKKNRERVAVLLMVLLLCISYLLTPLTASVPLEAIVYANVTTATGGALVPEANKEYTISNLYSDYVVVNGSSEQEVIVKAGEEIKITVLPMELFTEKGYSKESVEALCSYEVLQEDGSKVSVASDGTFVMPKGNISIDVKTITLYQVHVTASPVAETSVQLVRNGYTLMDSLLTEWSSATGGGSVNLYAAEGDSLTFGVVSTDDEWNQYYKTYIGGGGTSYEQYNDGDMFFVPASKCVFNTVSGYRVTAYEYTTEEVPVVEQGTIVEQGTSVYVAGERGSIQCSDQIEDYKDFTLLSNAKVGYQLGELFVFYHNGSEYVPTTYTYDEKTGKVKVPVNAPIVVYYTFQEVPKQSYTITNQTMLDDGSAWICVNDSKEKIQEIEERSVITFTIEQTKRGSSEVVALCYYQVIDEVGNVIYQGTGDSTFVMPSGNVSIQAETEILYPITARRSNDTDYTVTVERTGYTTIENFAEELIVQTSDRERSQYLYVKEGDKVIVSSGIDSPDDTSRTRWTITGVRYPNIPLYMQSISYLFQTKYFYMPADSVTISAGQTTFPGYNLFVNTDNCEEYETNPIYDYSPEYIQKIEEWTWHRDGDSSHPQFVGLEAEEGYAIVAVMYGDATTQGEWDEEGVGTLLNFGADSTTEEVAIETVIEKDILFITYCRELPYQVLVDNREMEKGMVTATNEENLVTLTIQAEDGFRLQGYDVYEGYTIEDITTDNLLATGMTEVNFDISDFDTEEQFDEFDEVIVEKNVVKGIILVPTFEVDPNYHVHDWVAKKIEPTCTEVGLSWEECSCGVKQEEAELSELGHNFIETGRTEATCTEDGVIEKTCSRCNEIEQEVIQASGHVWEEKEVEASCEDEGKTYEECSNCHTIQNEVTVPALSHQMSEWKIEVKASCVMDGLQSQECIRCGKRVEEVLPSTGHEMQEVGRTEASCIVNGVINKECSKCEEKEDVIIESTGHGITYQVIILEPTVEAEGSYEERCSICDEVLSTGLIDKIALQYEEEFTIDKEATCTGSGSKSKHCITEGYEDLKIEVTEILPLGHQLEEWKVTVESTCTRKGVEENHCLRCGEVIETREISALGHEMTEWSIVTEPTCITEGAKQKECIRCDYKEVELLLATRHEMQEVGRVEASCMVDGVITKECSKCKIKEDIIIEATGHGVTYQVVTLEPTPESEGSYEERCSICDEVLSTGTIDKIALEYEKEFAIDKEPTCTESGSKSKHCITEGYEDLKIEVTELPPLGHQVEEQWKVSIEAICTANGVEEKHCLRCGEVVETREISALGHEYAILVKENATCIENGYITKECKRCGDKITETIEAKGHGSTHQVVVTLPTYEREGVYEEICNDCGMVLGTGVIPKLELVYSEEWTIDKEPTCTESGSKSKHCMTEGYEHLRAEVTEVPALGHDMVVEDYGETTCVTDGGTYAKCGRCDYVEDNRSSALGHDWNEGTYIAPTLENNGYTTYTCKRCGETKVVWDNPSTMLIPTKIPEPTATLTPKPTSSATPTKAPEATITSMPKPTVTPTITEQPKVTSTLKPTVTPTITELPKVTSTPKPTVRPTITEQPKVTNVPKPTVTEQPKVTSTPKLTVTPTIAEKPKVTTIPTPTRILKPSVTIIPSLTTMPKVTEVPNITQRVTPTISPVPSGVIKPTATITSIVSPSVTIRPTEAIKATITPTPSEEVKATVTPTPSEVIKVTVTPIPSEAVRVSITPNPSEPIKVSVTPIVSEIITPTIIPKPTGDNKITVTPYPRESITPTVTPIITVEITPIEAPQPSERVEVTEAPTPTEKVEITVTSIPNKEITPTEIPITIEIEKWLTQQDSVRWLNFLWIIILVCLICMLYFLLLFFCKRKQFHGIFADTLISGTKEKGKKNEKTKETWFVPELVDRVNHGEITIETYIKTLKHCGVSTIFPRDTKMEISIQEDSITLDANEKKLFQILQKVKGCIRVILISSKEDILIELIYYKK